MRKDRQAPQGELHRLTIDSKVLTGNMLGEPSRRDVHVYTPAGWDGKARLPLLVDLVGFTGSGFSHTNWRNFGESVPERLDRLIAREAMPPVVVAFPDCFTRLGGNQYINSAAMGRWEDFLIDEMLPVVEEQLGCGGAGRRGVFGKSSGGFGAMIHAMRRADVWAAAACHSGDMGFDLLFLSDFPRVLRTLARCELSIQKFVENFEGAEKHSNEDVHVLMTLAMGATYDPDPAAFCGIRLPVDLETCELIEDRWARWLAWDPVRIAHAHADNLRSLKGLYIDCGETDQYNLVYGARQLHRSLERLGVEHVYEEFPDDHSNIDYRMNHSLPFLARVLNA
jgi:enterochelin esterase-like enzyme